MKILRIVLIWLRPLALIATLLCTAGCEPKLVTPAVPKVDALNDQYLFSNESVLKLGMLFKRDATKYTFTTSVKCSPAISVSFKEAQITPGKILDFTSEDSWKGSLGVSYQAISGSLNLNSSNFYTITASTISGERLEQQQDQLDKFSYCCSLNASHCKALGDSYITEVGEVEVKALEYEALGGDVKVSELTGYIASGAGTFKRSSRSEQTAKLKYFRIAPLPDIVQPDLERDVAIAPLRILYNPLNGTDKVYDKFLHISISEGRKAGFKVTLSPAKPDVFRIEEPNRPDKKTDPSYDSSSITIDCTAKNSNQRCEETLGVKLLRITEAGSYNLNLEVVDAYGGKIGQRDVHVFEVVREATKDEDKLIVSIKASPDFETRTTDVLSFKVEAPGLPRTQAIRADLFHLPPYLAAERLDCNRNTDTTLECKTNIRLTSPPPGGFSTDLIILVASRENLPSLNAVQAVVVKLPTRPQEPQTPPQ